MMNLLERLLPYGIAVLDRARAASWTRLLAWAGALCLLGAAALIAEDWLLWRQSRESDHHTAQFRLDTDISILQLAHDKIGDCIKSRAESLPQQKWYCDDAILHYRRASENRAAAPDHVNEVTRKRLFLAMQSEAAHYIRVAETNRRQQMRDSPARDLVQSVMSLKGLVTLGGIGALYLGFVAYHLWRPQRPAN